MHDIFLHVLLFYVSPRATGAASGTAFLLHLPHDAHPSAPRNLNLAGLYMCKVMHTTGGPSSDLERLLSSLPAMPYAGERHQLTLASNIDLSTRDLYCTNLTRPKPSLSRLHHKQPKSRTNTQTLTLTLHCRLPRPLSCAEQCALITNCPSCKRTRGKTRSRNLRQQQSTSTRRGR